jgi:hypothetical protein
MKKAILGLLTVGAAASALAQGTVIFENSLSAAGAVTIGTSTGPYAAANSYTVALLWAPGSSLGVAQGNFTQIGLFGQGAGTTIGAGLFYDANTITTGAGTAGGSAAVFEVEGWTGNFTSYAAAVAGGAAVGLSGEFLNGTGNPTPPATAPSQTTGWDGNLILVVPEPGTLALGGLGAAALLFFRRRK